MKDYVSLSRLGVQGVIREDIVGNKMRKVYRGQSTVRLLWANVRIFNFTEITVTEYLRARAGLKKKVVSLMLDRFKSEVFVGLPSGYI